VSTLRHTCALALMTAVLLSGFPGTAAAAEPHKATLAARWQADELVQNRIQGSYQDWNTGELVVYTDWGLTVDTLFALAAEGSKTDRVAKIAGVLANHVEDYTGAGAERYAGASAKLLLAAKVARSNVRDFGGHNLRERTLAVVAGPEAGFEHGRLKDQSQFGDYSNAISQSFGVLGLARTGSAPQATVDFLLKQRCNAGWFRLEQETDQRCLARQDDPDVDVTAYAVQALVAAKADGATLPKGALRESSDWLVRVQRDNGSFGGGTGTEGSNSNSTGLAVQALVATNRDRAAAKAADWVATLQLTPRRVKGTPADDEVGAIAYNRAALRAALDSGIPDGDTEPARDQWRRATAQGLFAFAPKPLTRLVVPRS